MIFFCPECSRRTRPEECPHVNPDNDTDAVGDYEEWDEDEGAESMPFSGSTECPK